MTDVYCLPHDGSGCLLHILQFDCIEFAMFNLDIGNHGNGEGNPPLPVGREK